MSLSKRMAAIVGDENTVARYLLEKVGHTAFIAWAIVCLLSVSHLAAAVIAGALYLVVGKILWHASHGWSLGGPDARDFVFDAWIGALPAVLAVFLAYGWRLGTATLVAWLVGFLAMDNNAWGSPS